MKQIQLLSVQVGLPQTLTSQLEIGPTQKTWSTAFFKLPVSGAVWVGKTNIVGDRQASSKTHGGIEKAVCVYPWEHYSSWQRELDLPELVCGAFGENFTIQGALEDEACIGDIFSFGGAVLQISQPRPPCWRLSQRWQIKDFAIRMEETGRTGWYCRVMKEGYVEAGAGVKLLDRPYAEWSVSAANELMYSRSRSEDEVRALAACDLLSEGWREGLMEKVAKGRETKSR